MRFGSVPVWSLPFSSLGLYSCSKLWIKITGCGAKNGLQIECWTWLQSYLIWINIYLNVQNIRFKACTQNVCSSHRGRMKTERRHVQRAHLWLNIMLMVYIIWFVSSACEAQWNRHGWDARTPARYAKDAIQTDWNTLGFNMEENYLFNELMRIYEWENVLPSVTATTHHSIIHFAISNKYFRFSLTSLLNITLPALKSRTLPVVCFFSGARFVLIWTLMPGYLCENVKYGIFVAQALSAHGTDWILLWLLRRSDGAVQVVDDLMQCKW